MTGDRACQRFGLVVESADLFRGVFMATPVRAIPTICFGAFALDAAKGELRKDDTLLKLHPQPLRVLVLLAERRGEVVSREEIQRCLWGNHTWVDFEGGINFCVRQIRAVLGDDAEEPRYIETVPRKGYRFIFPLTHPQPSELVIPISRAGGVREPRLVAVPDSASPAPVAPALPVKPTEVVGEKERRTFTGVGRAFLGASLVALAALSYFYFNHKTKLTEKDTVVIGEFKNSTGDPVFDEALKQGLAVELGQSPFLTVLSDKKAGDILRMMGRSPDDGLTGDVGRELCVRSGSKALVNGTISRLGSHYVVDLDAILCSTGDMLAMEQAEASRKEDVLRALSQASVGLRGKLGESLPSLQKYDVPIQATTTSLEALRNYSLAGKISRQQGEIPSIPSMLRAVELDPNFAMAYYGLARRYSNLNEPSLALQYATKAYELRDRVTEKERLLISSMYFRCTGEIEKQEQVFALWSANYPSSAPHESLGTNYILLGHYQQALDELETGLRNDPETVTNYENLGGTLIALNRSGEAEAVFDQASSRNLSSGDLHSLLYDLAFLQKDAHGMEEQLAVVAGQPGTEDVLLAAQADTEAFYGRLQRAREFSTQAVDSATRAGLKEVAAQWQALAALREAQFGEAVEAKRSAENALMLAPGRNVKLFAGLALAYAGEINRAQELADELEQESPSNTALKLHRLPTLHAAIELRQRNPGKVLTILEPARPYELGQPSPMSLGTLFIPYLRGQAFLMERNGAAAAKEFQKILDNPGIALNFPVGVLAHLQLARAYTMQDDREAARGSYQEFLTLWKEADADIPILKQAKTEYAKLR